MPDQLPTLNIGTVILSHCACAPRKAPLSRLFVQPEMQRIGLPSVRMVPGRSTGDVVHQVRHVPIRHEQAEQPAVEQRVAVEIGKTFPGNDCRQ
jgi:hypothetical protein